VSSVTCHVTLAVIALEGTVVFSKTHGSLRLRPLAFVFVSGTEVAPTESLGTLAVRDPACSRSKLNVHVADVRRIPGAGRETAAAHDRYR